MEKVVQALNVLVPLLYLLTVLDYFIFFFREDPFAQKTISLLLKITLVVHLLYLSSFIWASGHFPLATGFEAMTTLAFAITLVYFFVEKITRTQTTGPFILTLTFLFQLISSSFIHHISELNPLLSNYVLGLHTSSAILGYSGFAVAFVYGILYLMLHYEIKSHHLGLIYSRLPALENLFRMCKVSVYFGFVFLTIALGWGIFWSSKLFPGRWVWDLKFLIGVLTWLIYGLCILSIKIGLENRKAIYFSLAGFLISVFSLLAVNTFLTTFHDFM